MKFSVNRFFKEKFNHTRTFGISIIKKSKNQIIFWLIEYFQTSMFLHAVRSIDENCICHGVINPRTLLKENNVYCAYNSCTRKKATLSEKIYNFFQYTVFQQSHCDGILFIF